MSLSAFVKKYNINRDFVLFTLIALALCYLYNDMVYRGKKDALKIKQDAITLLNNEIEELSKAGGNIAEKEENLRKLQEQYKDIQMEYQLLFNKFPDKIQASKMLEDMVREENFPGMTFEAFYPYEETTTKEGYASIPAQIKVLGSFNNIGDYIKHIENLPHTFIIEGIDLKQTQDKEMLNSCSAELRGVTYILK